VTQRGLWREASSTPKATLRDSATEKSLRDFCVARWCSVVLSGAKCNGRRAVSC
jgi:hypothetical protein